MSNLKSLFLTGNQLSGKRPWCLPFLLLFRDESLPCGRGPVGVHQKCENECRGLPVKHVGQEVFAYSALAIVLAAVEGGSWAGRTMNCGVKTI